MLALALAGAAVAAKCLGACVLAFLAVSLIPWLQDVWLTRGIPPLLPAPPFIGDLPALGIRGMHRVFSERAEKYKAHPAFRVFVGSRVWVITADPESGRRLMTRLLNRTRFVQIADDETALGGGRDLATLRGERWRRMRLAWLPAFSPPSLAHYAPLMDGCAKRLADRLEPSAESGDAVDLCGLVGAMTLDVVGTTAFGTQFNALAADGGVAAAREVGEEEERQQAQGRAPGGGGGDVDAIDGKRLVEASRAIFARGSLTSGSGYQALAIMFPLGTPLWKALARWFPDANLRDLNAARRVVSDAALALLRRQRRREEEEAAEAEAAASRKKQAAAKTDGSKDNDDNDAANGHGRRDQQQQDAETKAQSAISKGILPGSFLAQLLRPAAAPRGEAPPPPLEDVDAVAQAALFTLAGFETTATTLACCLYALSTTPAAQRRVQAEVDAFFAARGRGAALTPEAVAAHFPFAEGAIKEALRLYPPVTAIAREIAPLPDRPHEFRADLLSPHGGGGDGGGLGGGLGAAAAPSLRPGVTIAAANYVFQRSPDYWPRAGDFLPERWVPEERGGAASVLGPSSPSAWAPFGGGPRQCLGIKFAMLEAVVALARLLERFSFEPAPGQKNPLPMRQALTLAPEGGVNVLVRRRVDGGGYYGPPSASNHKVAVAA